MCGIVGYLGKGDAYPALIKGLKRLEYRGYDSAGVALISNDGSLNAFKEPSLLIRATPAESYPRYSKRFNPLMRAG